MLERASDETEAGGTHIAAGTRQNPAVSVTFAPIRTLVLRARHLLCRSRQRSVATHIKRATMTTTKSDEIISLSALEPNASESSEGIDRRAFMMRTALVGALSVIAGCSKSNPETAV